MSLKRRILHAAAAILSLSIAAGPAAIAAEPGQYAYFFLQGKVTGRRAGRSPAGITIRLTSPARTFETRTDERGVFVFDKLPIGAYDLQIVTPDGLVMRSIRPGDDLRGMRLEVTPGRGVGKTLHVEASAATGRVVYDVPERAPDWRRFWKEVGIIVGAAGAFAL